MTEPNTNFGETEIKFQKYTRRRDLLPWWIKAFIWLFLVFFAMVPVAIIWAFFKPVFELSLLGLSTNHPFSLIGFTILLLFCFKGIVAWGLWTEKDWAINLGKIDAIVSTAICILVVVYSLVSGNGISIRLELIVLGFYKYKLDKIQYDWENFGTEEITYTEPVFPDAAGN